MMMTIRKMGKDCIYVGFPSARGTAREWSMPNEVNQWIADNNLAPLRGFTAGKPSGIFLEGEDAIAFRLKFSV